MSTDKKQTPEPKAKLTGQDPKVKGPGVQDSIRGFNEGWAERLAVMVEERAAVASRPKLRKLLLDLAKHFRRTEKDLALLHAMVATADARAMSSSKSTASKRPRNSKRINGGADV